MVTIIVYGGAIAQPELEMEPHKRMHNEQEITLSWKALSQEPQLVMIPIDDERGLVAIVKPYGTAQASCIVFSPLTSRKTPFANYRPEFLRKILTTDFLLREGLWEKLNLDSSSAETLRNAVTVLMTELERVPTENVKIIDMSVPANSSSAPDVAFTTFRAPDNIPFELALRHLMGIRTGSTK
jgi:hypothetical protein